MIKHILILTFGSGTVFQLQLFNQNRIFIELNQHQEAGLLVSSNSCLSRLFDSIDTEKEDGYAYFIWCLGKLLFSCGIMLAGTLGFGISYNLK